MVTLNLRIARKDLVHNGLKYEKLNQKCLYRSSFLFSYFLNQCIDLHNWINSKKEKKSSGSSLVRHASLINTILINTIAIRSLSLLLSSEYINGRSAFLLKRRCSSLSSVFGIRGFYKLQKEVFHILEWAGTF